MEILFFNEAIDSDPQISDDAISTTKEANPTAENMSAFWFTGSWQYAPIKKPHPMYALKVAELANALEKRVPVIYFS
jgi:hypothetical protein